MKKIAKSTLALVLAGTFAFSPMAMAEEHDSDLETVELQNVSPEEFEDAKSQVEELEQINPSLIPGDFFYFAKIALEKIRLAFTFEQAEEAELLATYAAERLAEAGALFAEGKEEAALEVIEAAVEYMESSQEIVDQETLNEGEEEAVDEEAGEKTDSDEFSTEAEDSPEDPAAEDDPAGLNEKEAAVSEDPFKEIEGMLRQNIIALKNAMGHVGNENAKAQLQKNIDKTYAKMAKKLAKLEEKYAEKPPEEEKNETTEQVELEPVVETDLQPADETPEVEDNDSAENEETMPADDDKPVVPVAATVKAEKEKAKQERKAEKAVAKLERKEAKQQMKEEKHRAKQDKKEEKKTNNKAEKEHGNGKGNNKN
jgi:hypothetical protein